MNTYKAAGCTQFLVAENTWALQVAPMDLMITMSSYGCV